MDFRFSDEENDFRSAIHDWVEDKCPKEVALELERRLRVVEVDVGVVALADLLHWEAEGLGREALAFGDAHRRS